MRKEGDMLQRFDIGYAAIVGFAFGLFVLPVLINFGMFRTWMMIVFPAGSLTVFVLALFFAWLFAKFFPWLFQFAKFAAVGALNFSVDFGILNILMLLTGVVAGGPFVLFKAISVACAIANSYLWNKFWVFRARKGERVGVEFAKFFGVSIIGIGINVGIAHLLVNIIGPFDGISPKAWANISAGVSVAVTLFWNFFGYKFFVFRKSAMTTLPPELNDRATPWV